LSKAVLATSLSVDTAAALRKHGSATLDEHYGRSCQPIAVAVVVAVAVAALLLAADAHAAGASSRAACAPRPADRGVPSQAADALSVSLAATHPIALANWDADRWQRHRVWITLDAANRGDAAAEVLPQMVVDARPDGSAALALFGLPMAVAPHSHATQRLSVYVPDDARTLGVRTLLAAPAQPVVVSFALECSDARFDLGEFAPAVAPLLDEAEKTWFNGFVDPLPDPRAALTAVRLLESGAQDGADVAWVLRGLMQSVGDDHGFVAGPGEAPPARRPVSTQGPELALRPDGTAVLRLHALAAGAGGAAPAWANGLHDGVAEIATHHPRAWVVDLRDADGDDPWPALAALSTLLDGPLVGAFVSRQDRREWIVDRGVARFAGGPAIVDLQAPPEPGFRGPVAVLIGPGTRNAGEDVAVAFHGRAHTRFFGAATAGFPNSGVVVHKLSDGTLLGVLQTRDVDRAGVVQRLPLAPDAVLPAASAAAPLPAEVGDWLDAERAGSGVDR
jgi:hypothetical protein